MIGTSYDGEEADCCWICLDGASSECLSRPCMCPRSVHPSCLARWQLQQAGRTEERSCRFCNGSLPDWRAAMACSKSVAAPSPPHPVDPVMVVSLNGQFVKMRVRPGPEGMEQFRQQVRELFGIPPGVDFECSFRCKAPSGDTITLEGLASYEAATHCASLLAAQRLARRTAHSTSTGSGSSHHSSSSSGYSDGHGHGHGHGVPLPSAAGGL